VTRDPEDQDASRLAAESFAAGDPTGWFERLYAAAEKGEAVVPWARLEPRPLLVEWARARDLRGDGKRALVVGSGFGDDAEYFAGLGFQTVAFDVSPSAIRAAQRRFPDSEVEYVAADLLDPPPEWRQAFDLVVESITVQALPDPPRAQSIAEVAAMVAPGGTLLVASGAREPEDEPDGPPWPLTRAEIDSFASGGLRTVKVEDLPGTGDLGQRWWRAEFERP
jgi:SAM-dependent methyltransferase